MKRNSNNIELNHRQNGFTIVEIMVAITLSAILIAGVIQVYLSSKESFRVQNELARLQETQRIAIEFLQRDISKAGIVIFPNGPIPGPEISVVDGGGNNSDSIQVRYESSTGTDCLGQALPANANGIADNLYFVDQNTNQLMCLGNGGANAQPIVDGVENMQVLLGDNAIRFNSTMERSADRYINPTINHTEIVSLRVALLTRSLNPIRTQPVAQTFTVLDINVNQNDRIKRQVVTTTIPFRNVVSDT